MLKLGGAVRLKAGSAGADFLAEAADLTGKVGNLWSDERGERISVDYPEVRMFFSDLPASEFVSDTPLDAAPF